MIKCAVLGSPISHSLSPRLHTAAYQFLGIEGTYQAIEMPEVKFASFFEKSRADGWTGFSLTMPLKERINTKGITIDANAQRINSVNTLYLRDGSWFGTSTDFSGFKRIFETLNFSSVCILGGGATARAALAALDGRIETISIALRNPDKFGLVNRIAKLSDTVLVPFDTDLTGFDLVISTVPAGATDTVIVPDAHHGILFDVLYNPWPTQLAARWYAAGGRVISGFDLLVEQALDQISLMTGREFDRDLMRETLNDAISVERGGSAF